MSGGVPEQGPAARRWWCRRRARSRRRRRTGWTLGNARYVHGVWVKGLFGVCVSVCVREREGESVCERERVSLSLSLCLFLSLSVAFSCSYCALSHNAQTRTHTPTPTPNITPTLVQRAGMPRFLRKPSSGEQGTRQGRITSLPPLHTQKHTPPARTCTHTSAHIHICVWSQGTREGSITPPHTHTQML